MNLLRRTPTAFAILACSLGRASEPVPNVTMVCKIFDTTKVPDGDPESATTEAGRLIAAKEASLTGLMALTAQNGIRCKTKRTLANPFSCRSTGSRFSLTLHPSRSMPEPMHKTPRHPRAAFWLCLLLCPLARAEEESTSNALFVCEVREIPSAKFPTPAEDPKETQRAGVQAASGTNSRLVNLKVIASASGMRSVAKGAQGSLEVESVFTPDFSVVGGNFSYLKEGLTATVSDQGKPGETYFLGTVGGKTPEKTEAALVQTASEISAAPAEFPNTEKKVSILIEFWDAPLETAAALVKARNGAIDTGTILRELRTLAQAGGATSARFPLATVDSGRFFENTQGNTNLKVEPMTAKDGRGLSVNYALTDGENQITAAVNTRNGDSLLLGTMESAKPGAVRLVFLHTSSAP